MTSEPTSSLLARLAAVDLSRLPPDGRPLFNRLIFEKSPYLLQHAENPIDWWPWGDAAFASARTSGRPVFLSIGYSTCHWCHVMEQESFEHPEVAALLNREYVAIKVDREERPDIDQTYMAACQLMTGSGGWPLTLLLTPEREPFFAATYLPRENRGGHPGLVPLLRKVAELWQAEPARLRQGGEQARQTLERLALPPKGSEPLDPALCDAAVEQFRESYDPRHGGFGEAPKFPSPHTLSFLLGRAARARTPGAAEMALATLGRLRQGGIFDQLGLGLHRYSVDQEWRVPHFEKMLYDQALTAQAALDGWLCGGGEALAGFAGELLEYVLRDLRGPEGGFCCGEDADSEGAEGTYYLWTPGEIDAALGPESGLVFRRCYGVTSAGSIEGRSVLHLEEPVEELARRAGVAAGELAGLLAEGRRRLFAVRAGRPRPHRDDKVITAWTGLTIGALARVGSWIGRREFVAEARAAAAFIETHLRAADGSLLRRYRDGESRIPGFLEDHAFLAHGYLELFQASGEPLWLERARQLDDLIWERFADASGLLCDSSDRGEIILTRGRNLQDAALPSGTAVAIENALLLATLTGDGARESRARRALERLMPVLRRYPAAYTRSLQALDLALAARGLVILVPGADGEPLGAFRQALRSRWRPGLMVVERPTGERDEALETSCPLLAGKTALQGATTAWLCLGDSCQGSFSDPAELAAVL